METELSGLLPMSGELATNYSSAEGLVVVRYSYEYSCAICGWKPKSKDGCIPALENHLRENHPEKMPDGTLWIVAYGDTDIKTALRCNET